MSVSVSAAQLCPCAAILSLVSSLDAVSRAFDMISEYIYQACDRFSGRPTDVGCVSAPSQPITSVVLISFLSCRLHACISMDAHLMEYHMHPAEKQ